MPESADFGLLTCSLKLCAEGGRAADYNKSSNGENEEEWSPKFVQEARSKIEEDLPTNRDNVQEDPAAVEKAKEKFWGRIAVISLGVEFLIAVFCDLKHPHWSQIAPASKLADT